MGIEYETGHLWPVFEGPNGATFTAGMRAKILQLAPSNRYGTLVSMLSLVLGQAMYKVGQSVADLGDTDKSQEWVWAVRKIQDREGAGKPKAISVGCKESSESNLGANVVCPDRPEGVRK